MEEILTRISELMQKGKAKDVMALCQQAVDEGISAQDVLDKGLLSGMNVIGEKFKNNEIFVPEVLVAARAMTKGTNVLKPYLTTEGESAKGTVVIGTVKSDLHDIGKNLVRMMMEGKGLTVIDLGTDVSAEQFIETAKEKNADIIACSALLTTTMNEMGRVVELLKANGMRDKIQVMVGGAPITQAFADEIKADYYTPDAATAAELALKICAK